METSKGTLTGGLESKSDLMQWICFFRCLFLGEFLLILGQCFPLIALILSCELTISRGLCLLSGWNLFLFVNPSRTPCPYNLRCRYGPGSPPIISPPPAPTTELKCRNKSNKVIVRMASGSILICQIPSSPFSLKLHICYTPPHVFSGCKLG